MARWAEAHPITSIHCVIHLGMDTKRKPIEIDFLYLDLSTCTRCKGTDASLDEALAEVSRVLKIVGVDVIVRKTLIVSEEQANALGFVSSPTILINGRDIQETLKESRCESCSDLAGGERCDCRVWTYQGEEHNAPPTALIVDAILSELYGGGKSECSPKTPVEVPENIKRFLASKRKPSQ